jgi:ferric-dicitrate binding protein FerR (iron transport regulator)
MVRLRSGSSLAISENSEVALDLANPTAVAERVNLHRGAINLRNPRQDPEWVTVSGASVLVQGDGSFPAVCRIAMVGQSSAIINDRGHVEIRGSGAPLILPIGQYATLEAGRPQGGSQTAGTVTTAIPMETVQRGQAAPAPLNPQDTVYWQDVVRTLNTGRVRIKLNDGSLLNVGVRSQMTITQPNAQSHQTTIELAAGKVRSQVQKISQPGGGFEVKTQTAVIGVVGTDFVVEAKKKKTTVWCIDGVVRVRNLDAAIVGVILLHAGEFTTIALGLPPGAATPFSPGTIQTQLSETNPGGGVSGGTGGMGLGAHAALVGAAGASAGAGVGAGVVSRRSDSTVGLLGEASTVLNSGTTALGSANSNSSAAQTAANNANQGSGNTTGILAGILQEFTSPTYPCGCH